MSPLTLLTPVELRVSRWTIDWYPGKRQYRIQLGWEEFDDVMRATERWAE